MFKSKFFGFEFRTKKSARAYVYLPLPQSGARGLETRYGLNIKLYKNGKIHSLFSIISSFEAPRSTPGEDRHIPWRTFCPKFDAEKLLFEAFFGIMRIFSIVQPKSECNFPFLYTSIFKSHHFSSPLAPLWGEIDICPHGLFVRNSMPKNFYLKLFSE